jgi:hypothetical protein
MVEGMWRLGFSAMSCCGREETVIELRLLSPQRLEASKQKTARVESGKQGYHRQSVRLHGERTRIMAKVLSLN